MSSIRLTQKGVPSRELERACRILTAFDPILSLDPHFVYFDFLAKPSTVSRSIQSDLLGDLIPLNHVVYGVEYFIKF